MHIVDKLFYLIVFAPILSKQGYFYPIQTKKHDIVSDLSVISVRTIALTEQNDRFSDYLKNTYIPQLDQHVQDLNLEIAEMIDCTQCGNCCKTLMIVVKDEEAEQVSTALNQNRTDFDTQYLEKGMHGLMLMNQMPCHFLKNDSCTIYENRFEGCREFPALHLPDFKKRLFTHFMHYGRCPIIFNVIEKLKELLQFENELI